MRRTAFAPACSYLGFGLMAGRAAVLAWEETRAANPCIPNDQKGSYEYAGVTYQLAGQASGASFEACSKVVNLVLKLEADCGAPKVRLPMISSCFGCQSAVCWAFVERQIQFLIFQSGLFNVGAVSNCFLNLSADHTACLHGSFWCIHPCRCAGGLPLESPVCLFMP